MNNKVYIYGLSGNDNIIRYVGKTKNLSIRKNQHINESTTRRRITHKTNWINKILNNGEDLNIIILEECNEKNWQEIEKNWIKKIEGLTNISEGGEGNSGFKFSMTLEEVMKWAKKNVPQINSGKEWSQYKNFPSFIPKRPDDRYKNDGWISWRHFFNFKKLKTFLSYNELKSIINASNINSIKKYREFRTKEMPFNPYKIYQSEWNSWGCFFSKESFLSYNETKKLIKEFNFTTKKEYVDWVFKENKTNLHKNPSVFFKSKGWISWHDFFGNNLPKNINYNNKCKSFLSYLEAKTWINNNLSNINRKEKWEKITSTLPFFIPKRPDSVYKSSGWSSWKAFLK